MLFDAANQIISVRHQKPANLINSFTANSYVRLAAHVRVFVSNEDLQPKLLLVHEQELSPAIIHVVFDWFDEEESWWNVCMQQETGRLCA